MMLSHDLEYMILSYVDQKRLYNILKNTNFPFKKYAKNLPIKIKNISDIKCYKNVKSIELYECNISDEFLKYLRNAKYIKFDNCNKISVVGLEILKKVKKININMCIKINKFNAEYLHNVCVIDDILLSQRNGRTLVDFSKNL